MNILKLSKPKKLDYCSRCHRRTEHIKHSEMKMCKRCSFQTKTINFEKY